MGHVTVAFRDGFSITEVSASLDVFPRWGDQMVTFCSKIGGWARLRGILCLEMIGVRMGDFPEDFC